jgi:chemotaxis protein methyltransferase CheR
MSVALERRSADQILVEGEFAFSSENFRTIAKLLYDLAGITLSESKATLVYSRLAKRVRSLGLQDFDAYCARVTAPDADDERATMLNALTTNLTRFYREPHHFDHLRDQVIGPMADKIRAGARVRIWSAGCSSGQEPYTIALTILSVIPQAAELDVKILASDIDSNMIAHGRAGVYASDQVEPIPAALREKWMVQNKADDEWRAGDVLRSLITFNQLNLMGAWPMKGPFQAIFCRNVVIYFDEPTQDKVWSRMTPLLAPGGRLYIGHSERIGAAAGQFQSDGLTVYRKNEGSGS